MKKDHKKREDRTVRIISGKNRGRRFSYAEIDSLRPTPDRVKETLFNWLSDKVVGADCLDLYSGSGSLGFEAASRFANKVLMVDREEKVLAQLKKIKQEFSLANTEIVGSDVILYLAYLGSCQQQFDLFFVDPPFKKNLLQETIDSIFVYNLVKPSSLLYIEHEIKLSDIKLPEGWGFYAKKKAGQVAYSLIQRINEA